MNSLNKIRKKIITKYAIHRVLKYIKRSHMCAYVIGTEIAHIYSILYNIYKMKNGEYNINDEFYVILDNDTLYYNFILNDILSKNILFDEFFTKLNIKIFKAGNDTIWHFLRGYYINYLDIITTNLNKFNKSHCVIYDYHIHYLTFIYEYLSNSYINNINMTLELNNGFDIYSINDITDGINYKLIFNHIPSDFNNPILDLFNLFYNGIRYEEELKNPYDIEMFRKYRKYKIDI